MTGNPEHLQSLGKKLEANYLIVGSIQRLDNNYILNARLFSVTTGEGVPGASSSKSCRRQEDLYPLIQAIASEMAYQIRTRSHLAGGGSAALATQPGVALAALAQP